MNKNIKLSQIEHTITEMLNDIKKGFHIDESRVIAEINGVQVQIKVTKDEDDFISVNNKHKTAVLSLSNEEKL